MKIIKSLFLLAFVSCCSFVQAQDLHFTMFDMAPLRLNPAHTGFYQGTFRVGGIYRTQWQGLSIAQGNGVPGTSGSTGFSGFKTPSAYIDVPFAFGKSSEVKSWAGVGASFFADNYGPFSNMNAGLSLAYHLGLGEKGNTIISLGFHGGIMQDQLSYDNLTLGTDILNGTAAGTSIATQLGGNTSASTVDFSGGIMLNHRASSYWIQAGFAANHFTQPSYNFLQSTDAKRPITFVGNMIASFDLNEKLLIRPLFFYQTAAGTMDLTGQALVGYHLNDEKNITILGGLGYRWADAPFMRVGLELKGLKFGFAYDLNVSPVSTKVFTKSNRAQSFELGLSYIFKIYKEPVIKDILFCPRF